MNQVRVARNAARRVGDGLELARPQRHAGRLDFLVGLVLNLRDRCFLGGDDGQGFVVGLDLPDFAFQIGHIAATAAAFLCNGRADVGGVLDAHDISPEAVVADCERVAGRQHVHVGVLPDAGGSVLPIEGLVGLREPLAELHILPVHSHADDLAEAVGKGERAGGAVARERLFGHGDLRPRHAERGGVCLVLARAAHRQRAIVGAASRDRERRGGERARLKVQFPVLVDPPDEVRQRRQLPYSI